MNIISDEFCSFFDDETKLSLVAQTKTANRKTGNIASMWLTVGGMCPLESYKSGCDGLVCGDCKRKSKMSGGDGTCYTNGTELYLGSTMLWKSRQKWNTADMGTMIDAIKSDNKNPALRMLRYGDSAAIPPIITDLLNDNFKILGYTHGWRLRTDLQISHMASVESIDELEEATSLGWRTFRAIKKWDEMHKSEMPCRNSTLKTKCIDCMACTGLNMFGNIEKNIAILEH